MSDDEITGGLDLLGDWLDAKGYGEEAGLCTRAMDLIHKQDAEINSLRAENGRLREALKPFAAEFSLYKTDFPDHFYISDLGFTFGQLRAAAAALEGETEKSGAGNE